MTEHAVPEVLAPEKRRRSSVSIIVQAREEAAPAPDNEARSERRDEDKASRSANTVRRLIEFDRGDCARESAQNASPDLGNTGEPEIERTESEPAGDGAHHERRGIAEPALF